MMPSRDQLLDDCLAAVMWLDTLGEGDAAMMIRATFDRVIAVLRRDQRMPKLTRDDWDLVLADMRRRAEQDLTALINGKADVDEVVERVLDELLGTWAKSQRREETNVGAAD